ncbi:FecR domain-containing protein [Leptospira idonii]|uniref:FecR protein domain-containing protein n=1 Tax=Leptospira idonii TaxID=1193500 RepID=A0A4R9M1A3_9LEPT|nr:FecR domain-containing protein [Leptospira idonii]TGN19029.1 hypothetical protein EHS15_11510 [Leptospira idonii]
MNYSRNEKFWIVIQLALLFVFSGLLYYDLNKRLDAGDGKIIGTITFKQRTVQRKYSSRVVWEDMEQSFPLRNRDSIRTANAADAEITLNDGTKINLSENSMILLNLDDEKTNIDFAYGSVSANSSDSQSPSKISIQSGDTAVTVGSGDVKLSKEENKELSIAVQKGEAQVVSSGKESLKIGSDEKAVLGAGSEKIEIKKSELKLVSPSDHSRFFTTAASVPIQFEVQKDSSLSDLKLEVSNSSQFKQTVAVQAITDKPYSLSLKEGIYYWRVLSGKEVSIVRKFSVIRNVPVNLISPGNNVKLKSANENAYVSFSWTKNDLASNYKLDISSSSDFSSNLQSTTSVTHSLSLSLPKGKYYWRVGASVPQGEVNTRSYLNSIVSSFEITEEDKRKPPTLFNPAHKSSAYTALVEKKGLPFNWSKDSYSLSYEFFLSNSSQFDSILLQKTLPGNFFELKEKLKPGIYYWKVIGKSKEGIESESSSANSFEIKDIQSFRSFSPESDANYSLPEVTANGVSFSWEKLPFLGNYQLQIAEDPGFTKQLKPSFGANTKVIRKDISAGLYYWRVFFVNESGETLLSTKEQSFVVRYLPEDPKPYSPKNNIVLADTSKSVLFQWSRTGALQYEFRLSKKSNGKKTEILTKNINENEYSYPESGTWENGEYEWSVTSLGEGGVKSKSVVSRFFVGESTERNISGSLVEGIGAELIYPINGQIVNLTHSSSIRFRWAVLPGIKKYKFSLSDGKKEILSVQTGKPEYVLNKLDVLDSKEFRWTVVPLDGDTPSSEKSGTFRVELDAIKEEVEVLSPDVQYGE